MSNATELAALAVTLALSAKPHSQTLHKGRHVGRNSVDDAVKLMRLAAKLQREAELQCNGIERWDAQARQRVATWTEADEVRSEAAIAKARAAIVDIVRDYRTERRLEHDLSDIKSGTDIVFSRDPRGSAVKVAFTADTWCA